MQCLRSNLAELCNLPARPGSLLDCASWSWSPSAVPARFALNNRERVWWLGFLALWSWHWNSGSCLAFSGVNKTCQVLSTSTISHNMCNGWIDACMHSLVVWIHHRSSTQLDGNLWEPNQQTISGVWNRVLLSDLQVCHQPDSLGLDLQEELSWQALDWQAVLQAHGQEAQEDQTIQKVSRVSHGSALQRQVWPNESVSWLN